MCISGLMVNERGKYIVEEGAHGGCRITLWMGLLFGTSTWKLFTGLYSTEGGTKHESGKGYTLSSGPGHFLVSLPCQTGERTKNKNI